MGLAIAALSSAQPSGASETPFTSSFPRLLYNDIGWFDGDLGLISRHDVLTTDFWNQEGEPAARLDSLRLMKPNMPRLAYINAAGHRFPGFNDPNHVVNRFTRTAVGAGT